MKIALTGGMATGKNYIAALFEQKGCYTIDADEAARIVIEPGGPAYDAVMKAFGTVDRAKLRAMVVDNPEKRLMLESLIHPAVAEYSRKRTGEILGRDDKAIVIHHAPLIIEAALRSDAGAAALDNYDAVILVWSSYGTQISRLKARGTPPFEEALKLIQTQLPYEEKLKYADFIIDNDSTRENAVKEVNRVYNLLKTVQYTDKINKRKNRTDT